VPTAGDGVISPLQFVTGRNEYVIEVDNTPRRFIVYVPTGYDPSRPTPVVVMCHGSNQHPETMYENTGWVDKAEQETAIAVFPASWEYPLLDEPGVHEKWNTLALSQQVPPGTELKDDVKFMRLMLDQLKATFNVNEQQIFASGFSNGGGFVLTRLMLEMNDVFAAYSTAGAGLMGEAGVGDIPIHVDASLYSVLGTNDNKIAEGQELAVPFPFAAEEIVNDPVFGLMLQKTTSLLNLEMSYSLESNPDYTRFTFNQSLAGADNQYVFMMIRGIGHVYPSGDNNRADINAADLFWAFFMMGDDG
jgi:polyhydroxybutyrate depolymerase